MKEENRLYQKLRELIRQKNKEILAELMKLDRIPGSDIEIKALLLPLIEAKEEYNNIVMDNTQEAIRTGMTRTVNELKRQGLGKSIQGNMRFYLNGSIKAASISGIDFDEFSHDISQRLREQTFIASEQTIDRMTGNVMENLKDSFEQGYGIDKAADNLGNVFENMQGYELERVARTEINGAQNRGAEATMLQLGIQYDLWRTAGEERVRGSRPEDTADHVYLDGQISPVGGNFSNGLSRPGDRSGPIAEWINCRCTLIPYLMPEGFIAPEMSFFYESDLIAVTIQPEPKPEEIEPKPAPRPEGREIRKPEVPIDQRTGRMLREDLAKSHEYEKGMLDKLTDEKKLLNKEFDEMWKARPDMKMEKEYNIWNERYVKITNKMGANTDAKAKLRFAIQDDLKEKLILNKEGFEVKTNVFDGFKQMQINNIHKSVDEFTKLVDESLWPKGTPFNVRILDDKERAYQSLKSIYVTNSDSKKVIIHEMSHYLEENSPGMHKKIQAFYDMRTKGETAKWLGRGYRPGEMFKKDKFIDDYMGKVYPNATEVLSMGMENIYSNPMRLMEKDPEMFDFIIDIIRGAK